MLLVMTDSLCPLSRLKVVDPMHNFAERSRLNDNLYCGKVLYCIPLEVAPQSYSSPVSYKLLLIGHT